ncbi:glycosyltransferase family 4 protein [Bacteroides eggerthii]|jgi:glycosyltransferase EpsD|uniref:Glycosyltransferase family 4 protein n=1 Tax=Bacteroides eggerthii TaxID=28111 RepID=A0ABT7U2Y0_9BACE|nr:glycosyltransferase family 4 protein [Bacteroides eggerthii]
MKKVLLTATVQSHICQFHKPLVKMLHEKGYEVHVAAYDNLYLKNGLKLDFVDKVFNVPFSRSPISINNIKAYKEIKKILANNHYDYIHCNTPMGGVVTRLAAREYHKKGTEIIYGAHGFHFYKGAPLLAWLIYYPIESLLGKLLTDKLVTISNADYEMAIKKHICKNVYRIHSVGINSKKYRVVEEQLLNTYRADYGIKTSDFVCICTGELNSNKRQRIVIAALPEIVKSVPDFKLLIAGNGPEKERLEAQIKALGMCSHAKLIGYRTDLEMFVNLADIAVSASLREGLGINLIEAMNCRKPVVGSINRGHSEFINSGVNGFLAGGNTEEEISKSFSDAIIKLASDKNLYASLSEQAYADAQKYMDFNVEKELQEIYFGS